MRQWAEAKSYKLYRDNRYEYRRALVEMVGGVFLIGAGTFGTYFFNSVLKLIEK